MTKANTDNQATSEEDRPMTEGEAEIASGLDDFFEEEDRKEQEEVSNLMCRFANETGLPLGQAIKIGMKIYEKGQNSSGNKIVFNEIKKEPGSWEEEFDLRFQDGINYYGETMMEIKQFIPELLQAQKDRLKGEIEKLRKSVIKHNYGSDKEEIGIYIPYEEVLKLFN